MAADGGIAPRRMRNQRLWGPGFGTGAEVVGWLVAMQAQEFPVAKWSVAQRAPGIDNSAWTMLDGVKFDPTGDCEAYAKGFAIHNLKG